MLNKKVLAAAVIGTLFAGSAAAADFTVGASSSNAYAATVGKFAKEIKTTSDVSTATQFSGTGLQAIWASGYAFSPSEVRYVRIEAAPHVVFNGTTGVAVATSAACPASSLVPGAINGIGSNVITFSVTAGTSGASDKCVYTLSAQALLLSIADSDIAISLYDQPSQAQAGGATGRIAGGSYSGNYFKFANSLKWVNDANTAVADVEADPSFTQFTSATSNDAAAPYFGADLNGGLGITTTGTLTATSGATTVGTFLDTSAGKSTVTITGDFTFDANANGSYTGGALTRLVAFGAAAKAASASSATFELTTNNTSGSVFSVDKTTAAGYNPTFAESVYTAKLNAVAANSTLYNLPVLADAVVGEIVRNGTELQAPLVQIPGGWKSRLVLTNTSGLARPYTISLLNVAGEPAVTAGTLTGTIPANGTKVIDDLTTVFTGNNRATLVVNVAGPDKSIQGLYQIVNPDKGSISNHVLVRPGSN